MFRQLYLPQLFVLLVALLAVTVFSAQLLKDNLLSQVELRLNSQTSLLRELWRASPRPDLVKELGASLGTRLTVVGPDGTVLADSEADVRFMDNHQQRPEILQARANGSGHNIRYSDSVHVDMMYCSLLDSRSGVVVRAAQNLVQLNEKVSGLIRRMLLVFLVLAAGSAALSAWVARRFIAPLRSIGEVARSVAAGDFTRRAPLAAADEIGTLASSVNRMSEELSQRMGALRNESSKLEAVLSSMEDGLMAVDSQGIVEHCNDVARRLFGLEKDPKGLRLWEALRRVELEGMTRRVLSEKVSEHRRIVVGTRTLSIGMSPILGGRGAVLVASDVSEAHRYDEMRKEFVANVSHELRTPLALVQGYVDTLQDGAWRDSTRAPEFLQIVQKNLHRLHSIVSDLLQLSRLESGADVLRPSAVDPQALMRKLRETFEPFAKKKSQTLAVEDALGVGPFLADADMIERAVSNLMDNAIKYTPEGGSIRVSVESDGESISFAVEDTGIGIPEADQARVFERFFRVDKSRSRDLGGTGLGLAIVKHIAQLHGGSVSVRSSPGKGSRFTLILKNNA